MKNLLRSITLLFGIFASSTLSSQAQVTILNDPCMGADGSIELDLTGVSIAFPADAYFYSNNGTWPPPMHVMTSVVDTFYNLTSCYFVQVGPPGFTPGSPILPPFQAQVSMPPAFYVDWPNMTLPICPDDQGTIELSIENGQVPTSVSWYDYTGGVQGGLITTDNPATLTTGEPYIAIVEDGNGCWVEQLINESSGDSVIFDAISNVVATVSSTPANCTNGTATVDAVSGGVPPYTYEWSNGATTQSIGNLIQGWHPVTVTDAEGCQAQTGGYVQQSVNIQVQSDITQATCLQNDGAVMAWGSGGVSPYTYEWANGTSDQLNDGLAGGNYEQVIVTDANGCIGNGGGYVGFSTPITVTQTSTVSSCTSPTGTATITPNGGTSPYTVVWNTSPAQTTMTATGLDVGTYSFTVTDDVGCVRTGSVQIQPESTLNVGINESDAVCPATTGSIYVNANGSNPPFTYLWNTGATSSSLTNVALGGYSCTVTDDVGCTVTKYGSIQSHSPVHVGVSTSPVSCLYACDGTAYANAYGGTAPYTYSWGNGGTTQNTTNLCVGYNGVTATDANGCSDYTHFQITNAATSDDCYCTITGTVFEDLNGDCILDPSEPPMQNIMIHCQGFGYAFTNADGVYSFQVPVGSYNISQNVQAFYPLAACQGNSFDIDVTSTSSGCEYVVDFANAINPIHDIHVITTRQGNPPVPGNDYRIKMIVKNSGTLDEANIIAGYEDDGQLINNGFSSITPTQPNTVDFPNWYSATSGFPLLEPGQTEVVYVDYDVPTNIPMSTVLVFDDTATYEAPMATWLDDYSPWNNTNFYSDVVVSSYDPNMVEVLPQGDGPEGFIFNEDSVLDYIIHFQNTGTWYAQNVVVKMTLDEDVQVETFQPGYSEDEYTVTIDENREVTWTFTNINLPWQALGEYISRGMVTFSIKQEPGLAPLTPIEATAAIYFDYNEPIITNTALNTIFQPDGVNELSGDFSLSVYPNPSSGLFNLKLPTEAGKVELITVYDLSGREVFTQSSGIMSVDLSAITSGQYLLTAQTETGLYRQKLLLRK